MSHTTEHRSALSNQSLSDIHGTDMYADQDVSHKKNSQMSAKERAKEKNGNTHAKQGW